MPFRAERRHQFWTSDVRHVDVVDEDSVGSRAYAITVLDNYSRAVMASAVSPTQDLSAFLAVLHRAVERQGPPEALVTDSGSIFLSNRAREVYEALGIRKERSSGARPGNPTSRPPSTCNAAWRIGTSPWRRAGRSCTPRTRGGFPSTTPSTTRPTRSVRTAFPGGSARGLEGGAAASRGPRPRLLRRALRARAGRVRIRRVATVEGVR